MKKLLGILCVLLLAAASAVASTAKKAVHHRSASTKTAASAKTSKHSAKSTHHKGRKTRKTAKGPRGQRSIDSERAREIQEALIREKYLEGEPSGVWDQRSREAMSRFQNDNGWQNKVVPDSRALIKLGLGPNHADLINPESIALPESARDQRPGGGPAQR